MENFRELLKEIPLTLNLIPMKKAVEDTLSYNAKDPAPSLSIIPIQEILSLPWRAGEYCVETVSRPPDDDLSDASTQTITSQCAGNPHWECEQLAAFLRAKNKDYEKNITSVVVLARSNDPWKLNKDNADFMALIQIVGSLITALVKYVPEDVPLSMPSKRVILKLSQFSAHNDLHAGLALLSAFPALNLEGKPLFLIVDMSDIDLTEESPSKDHRDLIRVLFKVAELNSATLVRVEATRNGLGCFIAGPGGTHQKGSKNLQIIYDSTEDR
ncbi:hypothetical protein FHL15_009131 [Xylaria flabelliformis]|uniref:Uncharacterized protein n=1 Tax=Xylaria flabelliformis TaxID=2512241 RepID=A0A553HQ25_9PEZI|nr:hypothetical protein FHL15_009131 [Xylaria flabelliformis]